MAELDSRAIRIIGIEGADASILDKSLPPLLTGGRTAGSVEAIDAISSRPATPEPSYKDASPAPALAPAPVASLMIETPVRSGQTIMNPDGDVIILGSVASGAEVISSGSIHVYGALRGRALAGAYGNEAHASSAAGSRPSSLLSAATTKSLRISSPACARSRCRPGCPAMI